MIAYKGFNIGLNCRGYQFHMGKNVTDKANCAENGFHCAENPLDCLSYYPNIKQSEYYLVNAGGDIDEDDHDSKISCTELTILKRLDMAELLLHALAYMVDHPARERNHHVADNQAEARDGFAIVRGVNPIARGRKGDLLALAKEEAGKITQIALLRVGHNGVRPRVWYGVDGTERSAA